MTTPEVGVEQTPAIEEFDTMETVIGRILKLNPAFDFSTSLVMPVDLPQQMPEAPLYMHVFPNLEDVAENKIVLNGATVTTFGSGAMLGLNGFILAANKGWFARRDFSAIYGGHSGLLDNFSSVVRDLHGQIKDETDVDLFITKGEKRWCRYQTNPQIVPVRGNPQELLKATPAQGRILKTADQTKDEANEIEGLQAKQNNSPQFPPKTEKERALLHYRKVRKEADRQVEAEKQQAHRDLVLGDFTIYAWAVDANCDGEDPDLFFPERGASTRYAKKICSECDVKSDCLQAALERGEKFGIWGGTSERERRRLRRQLAQARRKEAEAAKTLTN